MRLACLAVAVAAAAFAEAPPPAKKPSKEDLEAARASAEKAAAALMRAQAKANEAIKSCPAADAPVTLEELTTVGDLMLLDRKDPWLGKSPQTARVQAVGLKLAKKSAKPDAAWNFAVFQSDALETIAYPPATVAISTAVLKAVENDAQLAGLLGHEMGHLLDGSFEKVLAQTRHSACIPIETVKAYRAEGVAGGLPMDMQETTDLKTAVVRSITRLRRAVGIGKDAEHAADRAALGLLAAAGYPPAELAKAISRLGAVPNHPPVADRLAELAKAPPPPKNLK